MSAITNLNENENENENENQTLKYAKTENSETGQVNHKVTQQQNPDPLDQQTDIGQIRGPSGQVTIEEKNEVFLITIDPLSKESVDQLLEQGEPPPKTKMVDPDNLLHGICEKELVENLFVQKTRMDKLFDDNMGRFYYQARNRMFAQDACGSVQFRNRAGDKLTEAWTVLEEQYDIAENSRFQGLNPKQLESNPNKAFFDICGGPGSWSEVLMKRLPDWYGYGMTLATAEKSVQWYPALKEDQGWRDLFQGESGDVYLHSNIEKAKNRIADDNKAVVLMVGDGGISVSSENTQHMENYQELISIRIMFSEFVFMLQILEEGGVFVCKFYDTFSWFTTSIIFAAALFFDELYIIKPLHSRIVNSERYLVGRGKRNLDPYRALVAHIMDVHRTWESDAVPQSLVPIAAIKTNTSFLDAIRKATIAICEKQTKALELVLDEALTQAEKQKNRRPPNNQSNNRPRFNNNNNNNRSFNNQNNYYNNNNYNNNRNNNYNNNRNNNYNNNRNNNYNNNRDNNYNNNRDNNNRNNYYNNNPRFNNNNHDNN